VKKIFIAALAILLSACQPAPINSVSDAEVQELKAELKELKHIQALVAQKVGMGELVRPDEISIEDGERIGEDTASLVLIEFTDLHCPFCAKFHENVWPEIKADWVDTGKVMFVGKELPLAKIHPKAAYAAVTLRCAAVQNAYSPTKDFLFEKGQAFGEADLADIITENKLDEVAFNECLKDGSIHKKITNSLLQARKLGFASTPTFVIGKRKGDMITDYEVVSGAGSVENFAVIFDKLLEK